MDDTWQKAVESERGLRIKVRSAKEAWHTRSRLYGARERARKESKKLFAPDHPQHGKSFYEDFVIRLEDHKGEPIHSPSHVCEHAFVLLVKTDSIQLEITEL